MGLRGGEREIAKQKGGEGIGRERVCPVRERRKKRGVSIGSRVTTSVCTSMWRVTLGL
jgi:hypothetical protein